MKSTKEIEIQLKSYRTRTDNMGRQNNPKQALSIYTLTSKIEVLEWVLGK